VAYCLQRKPTLTTTDLDTLCGRLLVPATDIRVGDDLVERDGACLRVNSVRREGRHVVVTFDRSNWIVCPATATLNARRSYYVAAAQRRSISVDVNAAPEVIITP
jgi:hypothetical protein